MCAGVFLAQCHAKDGSGKPQRRQLVIDPFFEMLSGFLTRLGNHFCLLVIDAPRFVEFRFEHLWVVHGGREGLKLVGHFVQTGFERLRGNTVLAPGIVQRAKALIDPLELIRLYRVIVAVPLKFSDDFTELCAKTVDLIGERRKPRIKSGKVVQSPGGSGQHRGGRRRLRLVEFLKQIPRPLGEFLGVGKTGMFSANLRIFFGIGLKRIQLVNLMAKQGFMIPAGIQARLGSSEFCRPLGDLGGRFGQHLDVRPNACTVIKDGTLDLSLQQPVMLVLAMNVREQGTQFTQ